jgi:hypothetical protein
LQENNFVDRRWKKRRKNNLRGNDGTKRDVKNQDKVG